MSNFTLTVDGSLPGKLSFELGRQSEKPEEPVCSNQETQLKIDEINTNPAHVTELLPPDIINKLMQWVVDDPTVDLLAIACANDVVAGIPWEYLPQLLQLPSIFVVRLFTQADPHGDKRQENDSRLLAAGWSGSPNFKLPGIREELAALNQLGKTPDFEVNVFSEIRPDEFAIKFGGLQPDFLHLIPAGLLHDGQVPEMVLSDGTTIKYVSTDSFLDSLPADLLPRLVVLNTCGGGDSGGGSSAVRIIAERMHTMVIGWIGTIQDRAAVGFARYLYTGLLNGKSIIDVLYSYRALQPSNRNWDQPTRDVRAAGPWKPNEAVQVVWTPSIELVTEPLRRQRKEDATPSEEREAPVSKAVKAEAPGAQHPRAEAQVSVRDQSDFPTLTIKLTLREALNPALMRNGQSPILSFELCPNQKLRNVEVAISCDTGDRTSTFRQTLDPLEKGDNQVEGWSNWDFPVLYEFIRTAGSRRKINFTVICSIAGDILAESTTSVLWMGKTEWLDQEETWCYLPAFVDPYADGVLDVIGEADKVLTSIKSSASSFNGYSTPAHANVDTQVMAIFNCLREVFHLRYIGAPPIPVYKVDKRVRIGQRVRTPDEVVERRAGTCHDLAILFASCLEHIGIHPIIILVRGHTCVGYWTTAEAHTEFWKEVRASNSIRPQSGEGGYWTMDRKEIEGLLKDGKIKIVETTMVGDRNAEFTLPFPRTGALEEGQSYAKKDGFDIAVDVSESRYMVQPL